MTEQSPSQYQSPGRAAKATSGWAVGFILFAAIIMLMAGIFLMTREPANPETPTTLAGIAVSVVILTVTSP